MSELNDFIRPFETFPRAAGLGGTDAAALMGLHPYKTALAVYLAKHDLAAPFVPSDAVIMGTKLEPIVADLYFDRRGLKSDHRQLEMITPGTLVHPVHSFAYGSPDRIIVDADGRWLWGLEIKTAGSRAESRWGESGSNKFPQEHLLQCIWYMWIVRALCALRGWEPITYWDLAVLIAGQEYRHYRIFHDEELERNLFEGANAFWAENVAKEVPPEIVPRDEKNLPRLWPHDDGYMIDANDQQRALVMEYNNLMAEIAELETRRDEAKTAIKVIIGEATGLEGPGFKITWKHRRPPRRVDYKGIVASLNPPSDVIESYTKHLAPQRPFLARFFDD